MTPANPDLEWYSSVSKEKGISTHCPHATVHDCHRYFESLALLSDTGIATKMPQVLHDQLLAKWRSHELWPSTGEGSTSVSGGELPNCFVNFCPEVAHDIFKLFASTITGFRDEIDRLARYQGLAAEGVSSPNNWRWNYEHVEPRHYSDCPVYSRLQKGGSMPQVTIHGNVTGQLNIGGESVTSPALHLSLGDLLSKIDSSNASQQEKASVKAKLKELLAHPLVAAIVGGVAGGIAA